MTRGQVLLIIGWIVLFLFFVALAIFVDLVWWVLVGLVFFYGILFGFIIPNWEVVKDWLNQPWWRRN